MKIKDYLIVLIFFTIIIFLPFIIYIWYIQPIDETLFCDANRNCVFEQTRFPYFKKQKFFYVYRSYNIESHKVYVATSTRGRNIFAIAGRQHSFLFEHENLFDFPYCVEDYNDSVCEPYVKNVLLQFEDYKNFPEREFYLKSLAKEYNRFWVGILFGFVLWLIIAWTGYIETEEYKKQKKKKKKKRNR